MSEDTFERDLRLVLRELAPADAPTSLREAAAAVPRTHTAPRLAARPANRQRWLAYAGIAAVIAIAVLGLAVGLGGRFNGNVAGPSPTATSSAPRITWIKLTYAFADRAGSSSAAASPAPGDAAKALDIILGRLQAERVPYAASTLANGFTVTVPDDPSATVEKLIGVTGEVDFVPMGNEAVRAGATIDLVAHPPLFGNGSVTSAVIGSDQTGQRTVDIRLSPAARDAFATYTAAHIGEYFAIVLDGTVVSAPVIQSSIPNGQVQVQSGGIGGMPLADAQRLIQFLEAGALPWPLQEVSAERVPQPSGLWTPAPLPSQSGAPTPAARTPTPSDVPSSAASGPGFTSSASDARAAIEQTGITCVERPAVSGYAPIECQGSSSALFIFGRADGSLAGLSVQAKDAPITANAAVAALDPALEVAISDQATLEQTATALGTTTTSRLEVGGGSLIVLLGSHAGAKLTPGGAWITSASVLAPDLLAVWRRSWPVVSWP